MTFNLTLWAHEFHNLYQFFQLWFPNVPTYSSDDIHHQRNKPVHTEGSTQHHHWIWHLWHMWRCHLGHQSYTPAAGGPVRPSELFTTWKHSICFTWTQNKGGDWWEEFWSVNSCCTSRFSGISYPGLFSLYLILSDKLECKMQSLRLLIIMS